MLGVEQTERAVRDLHHQVQGRDQVDERDELWALLATLGPRQRAVLVLRFWISAKPRSRRVLGCTTGTVKCQLSRGLARLRERMPAEPQTRNTLMEEPR